MNKQYIGGRISGKQVVLKNTGVLKYDFTDILMSAH